MEMDRAHAEENELQYHEAGPRVEPTRITKAWKAEEHLAKRTIIRFEENWQNLGKGKDHRTRQRQMESHCSRPMPPTPPLGRSGLNK